MLQKIILYIAHMFALILWAILGLIIWIPIVVRGILLVIAASVVSPFSGKDGHILLQKVNNILKSYISIYPNGFKLIFDSISRINSNQNVNDDEDDTFMNLNINANLYLKESIFSLISWFIFLLIWLYFPVFWNFLWH